MTSRKDLEHAQRHTEPAAFCEGKQGFDSLTLANRVAGTGRRRDVRLSAYRCSACARFHVGCGNGAMRGRGTRG